MVLKLSSAAPNMSSADSAVLPPLETGSFIAGHADESQFIGSASGVFFANTVLRAFSKSSVFSWSDGAPDTPDADSVHERLVGLDGLHIPMPADNFMGQSFRASEEEPGGRRPSYGVEVPDLGRPPPAADANHLMYLYFTHWHPFFPFLHGPSFIPEMERFYNSTVQEFSPSHPNLREKLCRAVTYQCVFMVAGSMHYPPEPASRIRSTSALLGLVGHLSTHHDMHSLRALLAMEMYMISVSSLRAASTVNGVLTRLMYHGGYHRCPYRYVQLTNQARIIRKRMFWCAYVVDRYLSQALGLPLGFNDQDIDVCIPEMGERHRTPIQPHGMSATASSHTDTPSATNLPDRLGARARFDDGEVETAGSGVSDCPRRAGTPGGLDAQCTGKQVLGYLVTYSRLVGQALDLFHRSVHVRMVSRERVQDITYQVHAWWNDLPAPFQVFEHSPSEPPYGGLFTMLRHNLLLLIHRPFLSLPTQKVEFKLSMQVLIDICRNIANHFPSCTKTVFLTAWPVTLSTIWMTGLVVSYATLLGLYSLHKASM